MPVYLLIGSSRGIGGLTAQYLVAKGAEILGVSLVEAKTRLLIATREPVDKGLFFSRQPMHVASLYWSSEHSCNIQSK